MARRRYYARSRTFVKKYYSRGRRFYGKNRRGIMSGTYLAGIAASFVMPTTGNQMADTAIMAAAVAPIPGFGPIKGAAQGYILGKILQSFIGNPLKSGGAGGEVV